MSQNLSYISLTKMKSRKWMNDLFTFDLIHFIDKNKFDPGQKRLN